MENLNHKNTFAPKHFKRQAAEKATNHQLRCIQAEVEVLRQESDIKPLVVGAIVPATNLQELLAQGVNLSKNIVVIFLPEELEPHVREIATQNYDLAPAWDIKKSQYMSYHTWNIPNFYLTDPRFDPELKSQLWIPNPCMYEAFGGILEGDPAELLPLVFVTSTDVYIAYQFVDHEHLVDLQVMDSSAANARPIRLFTQRQLRLAEEEAQKVGQWPWMQGVWPLYAGCLEDSVNVVGGALVNLADAHQNERGRFQNRSATATS